MTKLNRNLVFAIFISISLTTQAQMIPDFGARFESFSGKIPRQDVKINCMDSDGEFVYLGTENNGLLKIRYINQSPGSVVIDQYGATFDPKGLKVKDYKLLNSNNRISITALTLDKEYLEKLKR